MDNKDYQELLAHISMLLGMGGNQIKEAENYLNSKALSCPAILLANLIILCEHSQDFAIKKISLVLLRRYFKEQGKGIWTKTSKQEQEHIRAELIRVFKLQSEIKILRQYCYTINELLGTMDDENEEWPELEQLVQSMLQNSVETSVEIGLRLLDALATYKSKKLMLQKEVMCGVLESAFQKGIEIQLRACIVLCSLLSVINTKDAKMFQPFLPRVSETMEKFVAAHKEDEVKELLESLTDVAEAEPTFFKNGFLVLYKLAVTFAKKNSGLEEATRHMMIEFILSIIERIPSVCKQEILEDLCSNVFQIMAEIDSDVDQDWCKPKEGFNNEIENEEEENIKFGMMTFDRLCSCIGEKEMLQIYNVLLNIAVKNPDWRYKHAFLMSISQVGEYIDEIDKIRPLIPVLTNALLNECPKVRYASLHAIGQLADDMHSSKFTATFQDELLPPLISLIDDPIPRVSAHSCAALTNVIEYLSKESAHSIAPKLLPKLISVVNNGISIQKENAMTAISSLAEAADKLFVDYYDEIMPFLFKCLKEIKAKEYRQLRGQSIEAITIIGLSVGKEKFLPHSQAIIQELVSIQNQNLSDDDPQRNYLLSAWQRICMILEKDFATYLGSVMGSILALAQSAVLMGISDDSFKECELQQVLKEVSEEKDNEVNTSELESKEIAIEMICVFASELKETYFSYIAKTLEIVNPLLTYSAKSGIRKSAAKAISRMYKCAVQAGVPQSELTALAKSMIGRLWEVALKEVNVNVMSAQLVSIKKILGESGAILNEAEIIAFKQNIIKLLQESIERKEIREGAEEDDEDIKDISEKEKEKENNFQITITFIVEKLFEKHPDLCTKHLLPELYTYATTIIQSQNSCESIMQVAIYLYVDMIQYLGPARLAPMMANITSKILEFSASPYSSIRQAACYGIGILAKTLEQEDFSHIAEVSVTKLREAIAIKKEKKRENKLEFGCAKDNAIAAFGKIIKFKYMCIPLDQFIREWIEMLPLKYDDEEACEQNEFLIKIIIEKLGVVCTTSKEMQKLLDLIIDMTDNDNMMNEATQGLISNAVTVLKTSPHFTTIWALLTETQKMTITSLFKAINSN